MGQIDETDIHIAGRTLFPGLVLKYLSTYGKFQKLLGPLFLCLLIDQDQLDRI